MAGIKLTNINKVYDNKFVKVYDTTYNDGHHYYITSRRPEEDLSLIKDDYHSKVDPPDAVSCFVVIDDSVHTPKLLLQNEYRYPLGRYVLGVPAGLIEESEKRSHFYNSELFREVAEREIFEEIGIDLKTTMHVTFPLTSEAYSSPGFTDESNAIVKIVIYEDITNQLTHDNSETNEHFEGFELIDRKKAKALLNSFDRYPLMTYTALLWFLYSYDEF